MFLFSFLKIFLFYNLDIPEILRDNHVTKAMRQATPNNDIQEDLVVRNKKVKYYNTLTVIQSFSSKSLLSIDYYYAIYTENSKFRL